ncbi:MAG: hypothetical protein E6G10_28615 [Actinobacteria bacterium]|nr:MAG: hypothetical protein E6G10_28615 [Actinomycetota bacterium]
MLHLGHAAGLLLERVSEPARPRRHDIPLRGGRRDRDPAHRGRSRVRAAAARLRAHGDLHRRRRTRARPGGLHAPDGRIRWRADYGGAPKYKMYVPVGDLLADMRKGLRGATA